MDRRENLKAASAKLSANPKQSVQSVNNNHGAAGVNNGSGPPATPGNSLHGHSGGLTTGNNHNSPGLSLKIPGGNFGKTVTVPKASSFRTSAGNSSTLFSSPVKSINLPRQPAPPINSVRTALAKSVIGLTANRNFRANAERAIKEHKIYSVVGVYPAIRNALKKRGWVEKLSNTNARPSVPGNNLHVDSKIEDESDQAWLARMLRDYIPDFVWVIRRDGIDWKILNKEQIVNRFPKAFFTTKVGLAACMQNLHWFSEAGIADTFFPRCYRLCLEEEKTAFVDDYRMSACLGYLKWLVQTYEEDGEKGITDPASKITILSVDFAVRQVNNYIRMRRHEDIDWLLSPAFMAQHWDVFLSQYTTVVQKGASKLRADSAVDSAKLKYEAAKRALQRVAPYWPQLHVDGIKNIWICKPGARSRGKGIVVMNSLEKIMELLSHNNFRDTNWVVQKYIERPMLIYKTKFDIRQWFIITDWTPLTVWFYKESYVRFCTKPFSLEDFHESVHLCNNAVQCRYQNSELRDSQLPDENMWDCYTFQAHLKTLGKMDEWQNIYHGMKQSIMGVLLASQETVEPRKYCFELYGADFMLSEDLRPWLIEINSCPCMAASTSVTARMCAQCLEDTIKVVLDRKEDKGADTGMFELIYKQNMVPMTQQFTGHDLIISGTKLSRDIDWPSIMTKFGSRKASLVAGSPGRQQKSAPHRTEFENGLTFNDLVYRLRANEVNSYNSSLLSTLNPGNARGRNSNGRQEKAIEAASIVTVRKIPTNNMNMSKTESVDSTITGQPSKFVPPGLLLDPTMNSTLTNRAQSIIANSRNAAPTSSSKPKLMLPKGQNQLSNTKTTASTTKRSNALYSDIKSKYIHNAEKNGTMLNRMMKNSGVTNALLADMVRTNQASNTSVLKKIEERNSKPMSPYSSSPVRASNNNTSNKQRSRPNTAVVKPSFEGSNSAPITTANRSKDDSSLPSVEDDNEKYGKLQAHAYTTSIDNLSVISVSTDPTESCKEKVEGKHDIFNDNTVLQSSNMYLFNNSHSKNSSTTNQVSFPEEPSLSKIANDEVDLAVDVPAILSISLPEKIATPLPLPSPPPTEPVLINLVNSTSNENLEDKEAEPLQIEIHESQTVSLSQKKQSQSRIDLTTAYSQLYMIFPISPNYNFSEQDEVDDAVDDDVDVEADAGVDINTEVIEIADEGCETDTESKTVVLNFKERRIETESQTEFDLNDLPATIEPEETDSNTTTIGNDSSFKHNLTSSSSDSASVSVFENSRKSDSISKRKKKKYYRDFCSNCFSILCRCKGAAALSVVSQTNNYQHPTDGKVVATNTNNNDPVPNKFPCYRIFLEQRSHPPVVALSKRSAATLPLKTINLNL